MGLENICGPETCSSTSDCISDDYVCQSGFMCVPDCKVYGCQNDPTGSLQCADDGLCYLTSVCEGDSDCDDLPGEDAWTCLNLSTSAISDFPIPNAGNFTSMCGVQCDTDEDCDAFPWGKCLAETTCISQPPSTDVFTNMTVWVTTCESDDDCTKEELPICMDVDFMEGGMCVAEDVTILENAGVTIFCEDDDDCDGATCITEIGNLPGGVGVCTQAVCENDEDCSELFDDSWSCTEIPDLSYNLCSNTDRDAISCSLTGDEVVECGDDEQCVNGACLKMCDSSEDCDTGVDCEDMADMIPVDNIPGNMLGVDLPDVGDAVDMVGDTVLVCNVLDISTTGAPTAAPTEAPTITVVGDGDAAGQITAFGTAIAMIAALLF